MSRKCFTAPTGVPEVVAAASLALAVMQSARAERWADVVADAREIARDIALTGDQVSLLNRHAGALALLRARSGSTASIAGCPECGRFQIAASTVKTCLATTGCTGAMVRAVPARAS
ncbi:hypothetical protein ACFT2C_06280 [Promicromonospora sp. NPDC057138]|uniref:hypothetical protein n=1 Tax=Promicromonospora sp. NPDC057138 TaxID=3346031 RepID=UPI003632B250